MSPLLIKISKDFATLWTTIDPIGNVALFAGLTAALTRSERHRTALRATIYVSCIRRNPESFRGWCLQSATAGKLCGAPASARAKAGKSADIFWKKSKFRQLRLAVSV